MELLVTHLTQQLLALGVALGVCGNEVWGDE
jgi:hypothetical protein